MVEDLRLNSIHQYEKSCKDKGLWRNDQPHAIRDAHAKSSAILHGELTVNTDIPELYRQGMFAEPGRTYPVIARISATSGAIRTDRVRGVRGLGLKAIGVATKGQKRASDVFDDLNQDFVFVTEPSFPFKDAEEYAGRGMKTATFLAHRSDRQMIVINTVLRAIRRVVRLSGRDLPSGIKVFADPNYHALRQTFYTAAPIRFGKYVAKIRVAESATSATRRRPETIDATEENAMANEVRAFFASNAAEYDVSAQLCTNIDEMPIENAKTVWPEDKSPYVAIATIRYPQQTGYSAELQNFGDDELTFNSWRAIDEHRPLGSINRLKLRVYEESSKFRHRLNGSPYTEPTDLSRFPGAASPPN